MRRKPDATRINRRFSLEKPERRRRVWPAGVKALAGILAKGWYPAVVSLILASGPAPASEGMWSFSLRTQGSVDFKPGNDYFTGPEFGYSNFHLAGHRFQVKAAYLTTRMEQVFRENILKYDLFLLTPLWHFRRNSIFDPTLQFDLGYARFDVENEAIFGGLDNDTFIAAFQPGLNLNFAEGRYGLNYHFGYHFIAPEGHLIYPGVFGLGVWMML